LNMNTSQTGIKSKPLSISGKPNIINKENGVLNVSGTQIA